MIGDSLAASRLSSRRAFLMFCEDCFFHQGQYQGGLSFQDGLDEEGVSPGWGNRPMLLVRKDSLCQVGYVMTRSIYVALFCTSDP